MTFSGGTVADGTIFKIGRDGSGFNVMHSFLSGTNDGRNPSGSLIQSGSTLYGMTQLGGINGNGVIFNIGATPAGSASCTGSAAAQRRQRAYRHAHAGRLDDVAPRNRLGW